MAEENSPESGASPQAPELGAGEPPPASPDSAESAAGAPAGAQPPSAAGNKSSALTPGQRLAAKKAQKAVEKREFKEEIKRSEEEARQKEQEEADRLLGRARPEPELPTEVAQVARTFSDFLQDHRGSILLGVGAVLAIALVVIGAQRFLRSGAAEQATQLGRALELANAAIDADDADGKNDDGKPVFKTEQERAQKTLIAFDEVIKGDADSDAAVWAQLGAGATLIELGKFDEAQKRFQSVYAAHGKQPAVAARALEGVGIALDAAGKSDEALKTFGQLKSLEGSKELAEFHIARITLAKGDREAGKAQLKALYDQLSAPSEGSAPSRYLKAEVEVRLAELDSSLVDKGGVGDQPQQFSEEQIQRLMEQLQKKGGQGNPAAGAE